MLHAQVDEHKLAHCAASHDDQQEVELHVEDVVDKVARVHEQGYTFEKGSSRTGQDASSPGVQEEGHSRYRLVESRVDLFDFGVCKASYELNQRLRSQRFLSVAWGFLG